MRFLPETLAVFDEDGEDYLLYARGSAEKTIAKFNSLLAAVPYDRYPIQNEAMLRALLQFYFMGNHLKVAAEQHNSKGRSDLIVELKERRLLLELKYSKDGHEAKSLLTEAVGQIISREYGTENLGNRELVKLACVFSAAATDRRIIAWQQVP